MSNLELFLVGLGVTIVMCAALAPLVWAAMLDGRYNDEQQEFYREQARRIPTSAAAAEASPTSRAV